MGVTISWAAFDAAAPDVQDGGAPFDVGISWASFDAAAGAKPIDTAVSWAEFDTHAAQVDVVVSWAQFDVAVPPTGKPKPPPVYAPGILLSSYYDDAKKQYNIPIDVDLDEEDDIIATILIELAHHVL
jgi:hypothetical protein